jgi:hypothetical protein
VDAEIVTEAPVEEPVVEEASVEVPAEPEVFVTEE